MEYSFLAQTGNKHCCFVNLFLFFLLFPVLKQNHLIGKLLWFAATLIKKLISTANFANAHSWYHLILGVVQYNFENFCVYSYLILTIALIGRIVKWGNRFRERRGLICLHYQSCGQGLLGGVMWIGGFQCGVFFWRYKYLDWDSFRGEAASWATLVISRVSYPKWPLRLFLKTLVFFHLLSHLKTKLDLTTQNLVMPTFLFCLRMVWIQSTVS